MKLHILNETNQLSINNFKLSEKATLLIVLLWFNSKIWRQCGEQIMPLQSVVANSNLYMKGRLGAQNTTWYEGLAAS